MKSLSEIKQQVKIQLIEKFVIQRNAESDIFNAVSQNVWYNAEHKISDEILNLTIKTISDKLNHRKNHFRVIK